MSEDNTPVLPPEIARALAARRRREERTCAVCGTTFVGTVRARYCSRACASKADYQRHLEERRATRREHYQAQAGKSPSS